MTKDDFDALQSQDKARNHLPPEYGNPKYVLTTTTVENINKKVMKSRKQVYILRKPNVLKDIVFQFRHRYEYIDDPRLKAIRKASYLIAAITYRQPFDDGNKSTGLIIGEGHLALNGLTLPRKTKEQKREIFALLNEVMISTKSYDDVDALLLKRVVNRP